MRKLGLMVLAVMFLVSVSSSVVSAEAISAELCRAKVEAAAKLIEAEGEGAYPKISDPNGEFIFAGGQGYVWIQDLNAKMLMHPIKPALDGRSLMDMKDDEGHYLFVAFSEVADEHGSGWVPYVWPKPGEDKSSPKISYLKLVQKDGVDFVIGSGLYDVLPADIMAQFPDDSIYEY